MTKQPPTKINVPDELRDVLLEFTISYLLEQPPNVVNYAVEFFTKLRDNRGLQSLGDRRGSPDSLLTPEEVYTRNMSSDPAARHSSDEEAAQQQQRFETRRKSVFAEAYDPEADDTDDGKKVVYPKSDEQRARLADSVKNILLFRNLDKEQMNDVLDAMFEKKVVRDEYVIKQGDDGDNFYVIQHGIFNAYIQEKGEQKLIHSYHNKGSFGELALLYNMPRAATIQAGSDGALWAMDRLTFRRIVLKSAFKKRKMYEQLIDCVPMLKTLQSYERMNLADALIPKTFENGDCIIKQGDIADGMYFVEAGVVQILIKGDNNEEVEVKRITKGGYFGELALVTHKPRAASAYAVGETRLAFLDVETFERLLGPCMLLMKRNMEDYETQLVQIFGSKQNIGDVR